VRVRTQASYNHGAQPITIVMPRVNRFLR
jgi:hypothetical protein